jgi:hypothetical protein
MAPGRRDALLVLAVCLGGVLAGGCRKDPEKERQKAKTAEIEAVLKAAKVTLPPANGPIVALPAGAGLVVVSRERIEFDDFAIVTLDWARAATDGVDAKYKRSATDKLIVPLANLAEEYKHRVKGVPNAMVAAPADAPPRVLDEIVFTMASLGYAGTYRLVRNPDGSFGAQLMAAK